MEEKTVYKVALSTLEENVFRSAMAFRFPTWCEYRIGEKTIPQVGKLFCFSTQRSAKLFIYTCIDESEKPVLLECTGEIVPHNICLALPMDARLADVRTYWEHARVNSDGELVCPYWETKAINVPASTILCNWVIPHSLIPILFP